MQANAATIALGSDRSRAPPLVDSQGLAVNPVELWTPLAAPNVYRLAPEISSVGVIQVGQIAHGAYPSVGGPL